MRFHTWAVGAAIAAACWSAHAEAPSAASVRELLQLTETRALIDGALAQTEAQLREHTRKTPDGHAPTPAQKAVIERMRARMMALYRSQLSWSRLEPEFIRIYSQAYTQEEVDALSAFYRTPQGHAIVRKMPVVMEASMALVQRQTAQMLPQLQKLQQQALDELAAGGAAHGPAHAAEPARP